MPPEDPPEPIGPDDTIGELTTGRHDLGQERARAGGGSSWQPYDFRVSDFQVVPETLVDYGGLINADADEFGTGHSHAYSQAMAGLPNFGMSLYGMLPDGAELTGAYFNAFQSMSKLMNEAQAGLYTLGTLLTIAGPFYQFADGDSAELLEVMRRYFGETRLWGDDPNDPHNLDRLQADAESELDQMREHLRNGEDANVEVTVLHTDEDGQLRTETQTTSVSGDDAAVAATDRTTDLINQEAEESDRFLGGDWVREDIALDYDPLHPTAPPEGHPIETVDRPFQGVADEAERITRG